MGEKRNLNFRRSSSNSSLQCSPFSYKLCQAQVPSLRKVRVYYTSFLFPKTTFVPFPTLCAHLEFGIGSKISPGGSPSPTSLKA